MEVERVIRTHVTTGELNPPQDLINGTYPHSTRIAGWMLIRPGIDDGSVQLIGIVKGLGEYLTSTEDDTRLKGGSKRDPQPCHDIS